TLRHGPRFSTTVSRPLRRKPSSPHPIVADPFPRASRSCSLLPSFRSPIPSPPPLRSLIRLSIATSHAAATSDISPSTPPRPLLLPPLCVFCASVVNLPCRAAILTAFGRFWPLFSDIAFPSPRAESGESTRPFAPPRAGSEVTSSSIAIVYLISLTGR